MDGRTRETAVKNFIAIGLACCIPIGLAAEDSNSSEAYLGTMPVLVVDDSSPGADPACAGTSVETLEAGRCVSFNRAVLTARIQKVSVLRERGRWM
jgi:hypothetical protein